MYLGSYIAVSGAYYAEFYIYINPGKAINYLYINFKEVLSIQPQNHSSFRQPSGRRIFWMAAIIIIIIIIIILITKLVLRSLVYLVQALGILIVQLHNVRFISLEKATK